VVASLVAIDFTLASRLRSSLSDQSLRISDRTRKH
jgi:hypothetical protein